MNKITAYYPYIALAALCGAMFFWNLGSVPLIGLDEGMYTETSREMLASGNFVLPTYNGEPFFDKPPLAYWLQAASMRVLGVNSLAARLPSACAALLLIALTIAIGIKIYGRRAGILAGFVLATALMTTCLARMAVMDQLFTLTITASLGAFMLSYVGAISRYGYLGLWLCMGLAVLVKGPVGAALILGTLAVFLLLRRRADEFARTLPLPGALGFMAISVPWYVLVQRASGGGFIGEFVIHQNIQRALGMDFQHNMPFYSYLPLYLVGFFPWSGFVPLAWASLVRLRPKDKVGEVSLFAAVWAATVVIIFSLSVSKLPAYIYPALPPSALLVGALWSRAQDGHSLESLRRYGLAALIISVLVGAALIIGPRFLPEQIPGLSAVLTWMAVALVVGALLAFVFLLKRKPTSAFAAYCAGIAVFMLIASLVGLPIAARCISNPIVRIAYKIRELTEANEIVYVYKSRLPSVLVFYSQRQIRQVNTPAGLQSTLASSHNALVFTDNSAASDLPTSASLVYKSQDYSLYRVMSNR